LLSIKTIINPVNTGLVYTTRDSIESIYKY